MQVWVLLPMVLVSVELPLGSRPASHAAGSDDRMFCRSSPDPASGTRLGTACMRGFDRMNRKRARRLTAQMAVMVPVAVLAAAPSAANADDVGELRAETFVLPAGA
ncbi:hypothetical protein GCM10010353_65100 [Streptomyces chryseus]|nr:hypothetical protein GCM10010353_65100 [Streptomyces chryseus]